MSDITITICVTCTALVADAKEHTKWHGEVSNDPTFKKESKKAADERYQRDVRAS